MDRLKSPYTLSIFLGLSSLGLAHRAMLVNTGQYELTRWAYNVLSPLDALTAILLILYVIMGRKIIEKYIKSKRNQLIAFGGYGIVLGIGALAFVSIPKF